MDPTQGRLENARLNVANDGKLFHWSTSKKNCNVTVVSFMVSVTFAIKESQKSLDTNHVEWKHTVAQFSRYIHLSLLSSFHMKTSSFHVFHCFSTHSNLHVVKPTFQPARRLESKLGKPLGPSGFRQAVVGYVHQISNKEKRPQKDVAGFLQLCKDWNYKTHLPLKKSCRNHRVVPFGKPRQLKRMWNKQNLKTARLKPLPF